MNREIKFRAWVKADKRMEPEVGVNPFHVTDLDRMLWKHDEVELMQFTGLKDKKEKDIYEGDILAIYYSPGNVDTSEIYKQAVVRYGVYDIGCNGYEYSFLVHGFYVEDEYLYGSFVEGKVTVIGNIFENPELLKP